MRNKLFATAKGVISLSWCSVCLLLFVAVASEFAYGGAWTTKTSMPAARFTAAAGVINGVLYVAGGNDGVTGGTTTLYAYNPTTDTWNTLASMPGRRYNGDGAGVINDKLYVAGGWNAPDSSLPQSQLFVYDPASNSWSSKASMPTLSGEGASGVINGKLYVTTATNGYSGWRDFLHVYDPATNTWSSLASSPNVHNGPAFGVINGKFYVAGGSDASGTNSSKLDVYDPATNTWNTKTSMPAAGAHFASGVFNGKLYAIGGNYDSGYYNTVYVYDPSADTWTTETSMPTARYGAAGGVINSVLYVAGGYNSTGTLATVEAFTFSSLPTATTGSATNMTSSSATLNGTVNANGLSTTAWFNYGITSGSYSGTSTTQSVSGTSTTSVSSDIGGLSASITYYYRIAAQSNAGTSYGSETSFTTITSSTPVPTPTQTLSANISNFPIATTSDREWAEEAAFDGTNYLVAIADRASTSTSFYSITAQLVSQSGILVGSRISVDRAGDYPVVAFDGTNYLMVWPDSVNDVDIYGQFISTAGKLVGTPFAINQDAGYQDQSGLRSVIFDGLNYFVVWGSAPVRDGCNDEYGQFVEPNGHLLGSPIKINQQTGCGGGGMTLTFDGTNILAVWISEWTSGGTQNGCWDSEHCESVNVVGQFITKSGEGTPGALSGDNFWISESPVSRSLPSVSFDGTNYLVVFPEDTGLPNVCGDTGCNWNISAYLLTTTGTLASSKITVTSADGQQLYPFVTFDGTNYLVTWTDMTDTTNCDIYGQYISSSGTLVGSPFPVDTDKGNQWGGFIGSPVNGKLFGIMENNFDTLDNGTTGDVYGMFLSVGSATSPTPTPTTTVTPTPTTSPVPTPQVSPSPSNEGIVFGFVNDQDGLPLKGVTITITGKNSSYSTETDEDGYYEFRGLSQGAYALTYEKEGYQTQTQDISLNEGEVKDLGTVTMEQVVSGEIYGYVVDINGNPLEFVNLKLKGVKTKVIKTSSSDADGFFEFTDLDVDTYVIFAKKKGYKKTQQKVVFGEGESTEIEIEMKRTSKRIKGLIQEEDVQ